MFTQAENERYSRHFILEGFGAAAQQKLKQASVLVIGAGGLGCPALLYLAAAGLGRIGIADDDCVSLSNLQRQVLFTAEDIGQKKVHAAYKRLAALNSDIHLQVFDERVAPHNALQLLSAYDIIIDATDNFATRYLLNDACVLLKKPLVYGAIFKFEGQVSVFNLDDGPTYRCLFPQPPSTDVSCAAVGVLGVLPGIIGIWQATEAVKIITGIGEPLKGRLLTLDLLSNQVNSFRFNAIEQNKTITELSLYPASCSADQEIDFATLQQWRSEKEIQLIDVREWEEYRQFNVGAKHIALSEIEQRLSEIDPAKTTVVHCQSGVRSKRAIEILQRHFPQMKLYHLKNGIAGLATQNIPANNSY